MYFSENCAQKGGGAIYTRKSSVTITEATIEKNKAITGTGGGVTADESTVVIDACIIRNNESATKGGGFRAHEGADVTIVNSTLSENVAGAVIGSLVGRAHKTYNLWGDAVRIAAMRY